MVTVINKNINDEEETITVSVPKTYIVRYDKECTYWSNSDKRNKIFINNMIEYMNKRLNIGMHVMMNDVFVMLGVMLTGEGYLVGWRPGSRVNLQIIEKDKNGGYLLKIITDGIIIDEF